MKNFAQPLRAKFELPWIYVSLTLLMKRDTLSISQVIDSPTQDHPTIMKVLIFEGILSREKEAIVLHELSSEVATFPSDSVTRKQHTNMKQCKCESVWYCWKGQIPLKIALHVRCLTARLID